MTPNEFRRTALSLRDTVESSHMGTADFRVGGKIFATLGYPDREWGMVRLTPDQQALLVETTPDVFRPVANAWGLRGYTNVLLAATDAATLKNALTMAWQNLAPKTKAGRARPASAKRKAKKK